MREPMFLLLMGAAGLYLVLGDLGEGLFLLAGAAASIGLVIMQEARSERALAALRELAQPNARVLRDGVERPVPAGSLVEGDILLVGEGDRLPADGRLVGGEVLSVDESALTGESAPVTKRPSAESNGDEEPVPGAEVSSYLFAGALVVRGQGIARVTRTGARSALGKIGGSLARLGGEPTPLQKATVRLVGFLGLVALGFSAVVAIVYGIVRGDWIEAALSGITVAIALIPEEFPMVLAVFLALGAWRLARHQVLTRRSAVIEALGGATVLCVDKTGTLTENRMEVVRLWTPSGEWRPQDGAVTDAAAARLLRLALLASAVRPVDPMDRAVHALSAETPPLDEPDRAWPLHPERLAVVQLWSGPHGLQEAAAKGAPEAVFQLCRLDTRERDRLHGVVEAYALEGLRVLGVASSTGAWAADDPAEVTFSLAGLIAFVDPLRAEVPAALQEARAAGIKVVMITGDHPATALAIAAAAGFDTSGGVMLGSEAAALSIEALTERLRTARVFARVVPEQKLRIVEALKAGGEVVAMTGDGVNDAPALQAAHIGVAMGRRGTDVAREAADLVLLDDSFASIVGGVRLGRRIFANLRRALTYVTAIHVPIAGLALLPLLLGLPPMLLPMHIVLLELIIDPTCALVFEAEPSEADAMKRPPRPVNEPLFGLRQLALAMLQGSGVLTAVLAVYVFGLQTASEPEARAAAFVALALGNLTLALTDSLGTSRLLAPHRRVYWAIVGCVLVVLTAILSFPALARLFAVAAPESILLGLAVAAALLGGGWTMPLRRLSVVRTRS